MSLNRAGAAAVLLPDGRVLVVGGERPGRVSSAEIYDPASNSWSLAGELPAAVEQPTLVVTGPRRVFLQGTRVAFELTLAAGG
jgi:hypothetical protein